MSELQEAIKKAIQAEKDAMNYYELAAKQMKDQSAKRLFEQLAKEEMEHAAHFFKAYSGTGLGTFEAFMSAPPQKDSSWISSNDAINADFCETKALEHAMKKENDLEKALKETAEEITDPVIKDLFELNARETHNHYLTIESEYSRLMAMVDESDMDTFVRE